MVGRAVDVPRWLAAHAREALWSAFVYRHSCSGAVLRIPVEPLLGLMRHPLAVRACLKPRGAGFPSEDDAVNVEDKGASQLGKSVLPCSSSKGCFVSVSVPLPVKG